MAPLRILFDVAVFRLRRLEMANMFAAVALMLTLRLPADEIALRTIFAAGLNLLAYLTNDYYDVWQDLASPTKDNRKTRYLSEHMTAAAVAQIGLAVALGVFGWFISPGLLLVLILGAGICWLYSWKWKRIPGLDVFAMTAWGAAMPLAGMPLDSRLGWIAAGQLALFSTCFESIQVLRDYREDRDDDVRTTAVLLGPGRTLIALRVAMIASAAWAGLMVHRMLGPALLLALLIPFDLDRPGPYWNRIRLIFGILFLAMLGHIWWTGHSWGWLIEVGVDEIVSVLTPIR